MPDEQDSSQQSTTPFDDFLDRFLRGEAVDPRAFVESHPGLTEEERRQIGTLSAGVADGPVPPAAPSQDDPLPVTKIGTFRLVRRIGAGASGAVYLADDESLGRTVAVKILGPDILGKGERAERFAREARAVASLRHRNIVTIHAAGEEAGLRYLAMEFVPGAGLDEVLEAAAAQGSLPEVRDVLRWGIDLAGALACAHEHGIVHRDVKPSNIRIADDDRAVLLDFGIARADDAATLTESGDFRGSPQYASPEQIGRAGTAVDARSDVYSLGVTLYELLTGTAPFRAATRDQLFHQILSREPMAPRKLEPSVPRDLETIVLAMLEKEPARRPQTATAVAADLEAVLQRRPIRTRPVSALGRLTRWARREPAKAVLAACLVVGIPVIAALGGYIAANRPKIAQAAAADRAAKLARILEDGFVEYGEGDPSRARAFFEDALRVDPTSPEAKAGFALSLIEDGDPKGAIAFLDGPGGASGAVWSGSIRAEALGRLTPSPETRELRTVHAASLTAIDHFVQGILWLERFHRYGTMASVAFDHLQAAVMAAPAQSALYHYELGHAAWHAGRHKEARMIAAAIELRWPESAERAYAVGRTLIDADREAALRAFEKAARSPPRASHARIMIAMRLSEGAKPEGRARAIALAREVVASDPLRGSSHSTLGIVLLNDRRTEEAIKSLTEAARLNPNHAGTRRVLAQALARNGQLSEALAQAREAVRLAPDDHRSWFYLGFVHLELGEVDESIASYERAVALDPQNATALCNLGFSYYRKGDLEKALDLVTRGHEIGTKDPRWSLPSKQWIDEVRGAIALRELGLPDESRPVTRPATR